MKMVWERINQLKDNKNKIYEKLYLKKRMGN